MKCKNRIQGLLAAAILSLMILLPSVVGGAAAYHGSAQIEAYIEALPTSAALPGDSSFTLVLEAIEGAPLPKESRQTRQGKGKIVFGKIDYSHPGEYFYRLYEEPGNYNGISYDERSYTVRVRVVNEEQAPGGLAISVNGWPGKIEDVYRSEKSDRFEFLHFYKKKIQDGKPGKPGGNFQTRRLSVKTGDESPLFVLLLVCGGASVGLFFLLTMKRRAGRDQE